MDRKGERGKAWKELVEGERKKETDELSEG